MLEDISLPQLAEPLLRWFQENARVLPWREDPAPYRVWVSEIMLQQTRVETVKPYFTRFILRLPDIPSLAACPEDELLKLWEGLGYYNRVRNMQKAALQIMEIHGGRLPADYKELLKLKGIGKYTAGAVASIAYGIPVPAVDGNVMRILARAAGDDSDIAKPHFKAAAEQAIEAMLKNPRLPGPLAASLRDGNIPGAVNQAMMELGATVCVPNGAPFCEKCPWEALCAARKEGRTGELPVKSRAKARKIEKRTVLIIRRGGKVAIRRRPPKGLLAGLYELPNVEGALGRGEVLELAGQILPGAVRVKKLDDAKHIFSHVEWHMSGYVIQAESPVKEEPAGVPECSGLRDGELLFVDVQDVRERYAIPSAFAAYAGCPELMAEQPECSRKEEDG